MLLRNFLLTLHYIRYFNKYICPINLIYMKKYSIISNKNSYNDNINALFFCCMFSFQYFERGLKTKTIKAVKGILAIY